MKKLLSIISIILLFLAPSIFAGTTGKIAGEVTDEETGEPLPGANVSIEGTTMGAATDVDGYYVSLNVPPGTYNLKATMIGYADYHVKNVRVNIDLTTTVNIKMTSVVLAAAEVVVTAERPIVKKDVAASQVNITSSQIEALPMTSVSEILELEAGIGSDLQIRGGGSGEALFLVDGIVLRDERSNQPIAGVPLSAVEEISVQSGGFSAEYNHVRSGIINVVTKEGDPDRYSGAVTFKIMPPQAKHFGISPYDPNSYWLRPYLDPAVAWTGTKSGAWDKYTQRQYKEWDGWNAFAEGTLQDDDPTNDLTPAAAQRIFLWEHRKQGDIDKPDYYIDAGFGGPVPFISKYLGSLRFYASFKREQERYLMQLSRDALTTQSWMLKLTSDLTPSMKLSLLGLYGETFATARSRSGGTDYMSSTWEVADAVNTSSFTVPWRIYTNLYYSPTEIYSHSFSAKLTHVLSPKTFYELQLQRVGKKYHTTHGAVRDTTKKFEIFDGYFADEAPIGFVGEPLFSVEGRLAFGGAVSTSRDFTEIATYSLKGDLVSQIDRHNQMKVGFQLIYNDLDMRFGSENFFLPEGNWWTTINEIPLRGSLYLQDKIEYKGFISSVGIIMDYTDPNGNWYEVGTYDKDFYTDNFNPEDESKFKTKAAKAQYTFSPRLAISHPITDNSKLYFNYGHYRQIPTAQNLYRIQRDIRDALDLIGDPANPLEKTVSYELGYEHALFDNYLFHAAAYYKDISDQEFWVRYIGRKDVPNYQRITNNSYEDIRGFELGITKVYGRWITGNINYEYRVGTSGFFGSDIEYENPARLREYLRTNKFQFKPRPRQRIKSYIDIHTPVDYGPKFGRQRVLGGWRFNFITRWTSGAWGTWNPNNIPGIRYNVQWKDFYNVDLKITKVFSFKNFDLKFFADIRNLLNHKDFSGLSYRDQHDRDFYMKSLHLPASMADNLGYGNIPGNDKPGDYRKAGVEFVPIEWTKDTESLENLLDPSSRAIYYIASTKKYLQYKNGEWSEASNSRINQFLEDKAYIDMPNQTYFTFLNPRSSFFGLTINYRF